MQLAVQRVTPGVVRATDQAADRLTAGYQFQAAVAADIMEDLDFPLPGPHQQQRQPHEIDGFQIARVGDVDARPDDRPGLRKHGVPFEGEKIRIGEKSVRQSDRLFDRSVDAVQVPAGFLRQFKHMVGHGGLLKRSARAPEVSA